MNNNENKICDLCDDWIDGNLSEESQSRFEEHLATCQDCLERIAACQQLDLDVEAACRLFRGTREANEPSVERAAARNVDVASRRTRRKWGQTIAWISAGCVVAALLTAAIYFANKSGDQAISKTDNQDIAEKKTESARAEKSTLAKAQTPKIRVDIKMPTIATPAVSNERFTFVQVLPAFKISDELDAENKTFDRN